MIGGRRSFLNCWFILYLYCNYVSPIKCLQNWKRAIYHTKAHTFILEQLICNGNGQNMLPPDLSNINILSCIQLPSIDITPYEQHCISCIKILSFLVLILHSVQGGWGDLLCYWAMLGKWSCDMSHMCNSKIDKLNRGALSEPSQITISKIILMQSLRSGLMNWQTKFFKSYSNHDK